MFKEYKEYNINENGVILGISGRIVKGTKKIPRVICKQLVKIKNI